MRKFLSSQLIEVETSLASVGHRADSLGFDIGDHADEIHWDNVTARDVSEWLSDVTRMRVDLERVEGLLKAYEIHRKSNIGE